MIGNLEKKLTITLENSEVDNFSLMLKIFIKEYDGVASLATIPAVETAKQLYQLTGLNI